MNEITRDAWPPALGSAAIALLACMAAPAAAEEATTETWALHGQATNVTQWHRHFRSPYAGTNSLDADGRTEETTDITLYAGLRLWQGAELWLNPELDQGFGLSNTVGAAGFPSGEAYKIGANTPYWRLPRAFVRHTIALGPADQPIEAAANQLASMSASQSLVLTLGKFSVTDLFDTNRYAHDPRADFLNWSVIDAGAFDYAADSWGFTYGGAAEWNVDRFTWRAGVFQLSKVPNGKVVAVDFDQYMLVAEAEERHRWNGLEGKVKLLAFINRGRVGGYDDAVAQGRATGATPDTAAVRQRGSRTGVSVNVEQALGAEAGGFLRIGVNSGSKEAYEFTEINNSISTGLSVKGAAWQRPADTFGLALISNGISAAARRYFTAGGIGILIGDGGLRYGREDIVETYYAVQVCKPLALSFDAQRIQHPGYNRDRGPVNVFAVRTHLEF